MRLATIWTGPFLVACGAQTSPAPGVQIVPGLAAVDDGGDASTTDASVSTTDGPGPPLDGARDAAADVERGDAAPVACAMGDVGFLFDGSAVFGGTCSGGCPTGTICARQTGTGGPPPLVLPEYCAPIPEGCKNDLSCACFTRCICGPGSALSSCQVRTDTDGGGPWVECDNGIP
jgi:hypothetical protein